MSRQSIATGILILLITNYVSFQIGQTLQYYRAATRRAQAEAPRGRGTRRYGTNQVLRFTPTRLEMGVLEGQARRSQTALVENPGDTPVSVKGLSSSCSCVLASLQPLEIPAHGKARLSVTVDPARAAPKFAVSVSVEYKGRSEVDRVLVIGETHRPSVAP